MVTNEAISLILSLPCRNCLIIQSNDLQIIRFAKLYYGQYIEPCAESCSFIYPDILSLGIINRCSRYYLVQDGVEKETFYPILNLINWVKANSVFDNEVVAFHGRAIEHNDRGIAFLAPSHGGKSTLIAYLCAIGY